MMRKMHAAVIWLACVCWILLWKDALPTSEARKRYIVSMEPSTTILEHLHHHSLDIQMTHQISVGPDRFRGLGAVRSTGFHGYVAWMGRKEAAQLALVEHVRSVELDGLARVASDDVGDLEGCYMQLDVPSWGLSKLSDEGVDKDEDDAAAFVYDKASGDGVVVYVLDTGLLVDHVEFSGGRATFGVDTISEESAAEGGRRDVYGHGTHVAGVCVGRNVGVAKRGRVVGLKMLDDAGVGTVVSALQALEWVMADVEQRLQQDPRDNRTVINMSFRMPFSSAFNLASEFAAETVVVVAASGNDAGDACTFSPGSAAGMLTVAATTEADTLYSVSNTGECVQLLAPGDGIYSSKGTTPYSYGLLSGTSQAAPHVSGSAALLWSAHPGWNAEQVRRELLSHARTRVIQGVANGTVNRLVFSGGYCSSNSINVSAWHGEPSLRFNAYVLADLWWQWLLFCGSALVGVVMIVMSQRTS